MTTTAERTTPAREATTSTPDHGAPVAEISLLGDFRLVVDGRDVTRHLRRRDALRLAQFLALAPGRRVHRERVVDALWPDAPFGTLQNRLHKAAHFLRRATGLADGVVLSGETVALLPHAHVETDVSVFERLAHEGLARRDAAAVDRAISLYRGDLLPDDPFAPWLEYDRHRLRVRLRELLRVSGRFDRLVAVDPTDEHGHVGIMRAMLRAGDRSGVLRQYALLTQVLRHELGIEPGSEARALRALALGRKVDSARRPAHDPHRTTSRARSSAARVPTSHPGGRRPLLTR